MPAKTILTEKQKQILQLRLKGLNNHEIAKALNKSDEYVSQTLKKISDKIQTVEDSIHLFTEIGIVESAPTFKLSEGGIDALRARREHFKQFMTMVTFEELLEKPNRLVQYGDAMLVGYGDNLISRPIPLGFASPFFKSSSEKFPIEKCGIDYSNEIKRVCA